MNTQPEVLLTENEAAALLKLDPRTLQNWRYLGRGPVHVRISRKAVRYRRCDLETFITERLSPPVRRVGE